MQSPRKKQEWHWKALCRDTKFRFSLFINPPKGKILKIAHTATGLRFASNEGGHVKRCLALLAKSHERCLGIRTLACVHLMAWWDLIPDPTIAGISNLRPMAPLLLGSAGAARDHNPRLPLLWQVERGVLTGPAWSINQLTQTGSGDLNWL